MSAPDRAARVFWSLAEELMEEDERVAEGTLMSGRCLRVSGAFLALLDRRSGALVVKLPRSRVDELIESGEGRPFAPAGKVFREWVAVPGAKRVRWRALLQEGVAFVAP